MKMVKVLKIKKEGKRGKVIEWKMGGGGGKGFLEELGKLEFRSL